jgi:hypothetical protein
MDKRKCVRKMIISFSTITFDKINNKEYLGGPADYGGVILNYINQKHQLDFQNICNINKNDIKKLEILKHNNIVINNIPESIKFNLNLNNGIRKVKLESQRFIVNKNIFNASNIKNKICGNTIIVSPVISEFTKDFFSKLLELKPKAVFLDLFNNDDGDFAKNELSLFEQITKTTHTQIFFKLSQNEIQGLKNNKQEIPSNHYIITTLGDKGARIQKNGDIYNTSGIKAKTINPTGAGDIFIYTFAALYDMEHTIEDCLNTANEMAAKSTEYDELEGFANALRQGKIKVL